MEVYYSGYVDNKSNCTQDFVDDNSIRSASSQCEFEKLKDVTISDSNLLFPFHGALYYTDDRYRLQKYDLTLKTNETVLDLDGTKACFRVLASYKDSLIVVAQQDDKQLVNIIDRRAKLVDVEIGVEILQMSIGRVFGLMLCKNNKLYKFKSFQCEPRDFLSTDNLAAVPPPSPFCVFSWVSCGREHGVVLTKMGVVYTLGGGGRGQLATGVLNSEGEKLTRVELLEPLKMVAVETGGWHTLALSESGDIYAWGWNESGQAGVSSSSNESISKPDESTPKPNKSIPKPDESSPKLLFSPQLCDTPLDETFTAVSAGSRHSAGVVRDGVLYTWGCNGYGQLGQGDNNAHLLRPKKVKQFAAGVNKVLCKDWGTFVIK